MKLACALLGTVAVVGCAVLAAGSTMSAQGKTQWDGVYTTEQSKRGGAAYARACSSCHAQDLAGAEMAPGLAGGGFVSNWAELSLADLANRIRTSMPSNDPGSLSRAQVADIVAFILSKNDAPAGETELPSSNDQLSTIQFTARK